MCSIFGQININGSLIETNNFKDASKIIDHRGPDKKGYLTDNNHFQFAFNRLSILDLNATGDQPMISECGRYICVFNGEIYNHKKIYNEIKSSFKWRGTSDTEVLLNAWSLWKTKTLEKIDGMFSFAIWDKDEEKIFIARDRIGEKPLYYYLDENRSLFFCSRPGPITKIFPNLSNEFENDSISFYLEAGYFPRSRSIFKKIFKLEPGSYMEFGKRNIIITKYWSINNYNSKVVKSESLNYYVDKCEDLLKESISDRLISDKPLGFLLSGGLDSSLVVAMASKIIKKENINAFNLGFEDENYDESKDATIVSNHLGIKLEKEKLTPNDLIKQLPYFFEKFDEPFSDTACFPLMEISKFAKKKVDVVLTGDGGDELFGGYNYYSIIDLFNKFNFPLNLINKIYIPFFLKKFGNHKLKLISNLFKFNNQISRFAYIRSIKKDFPSIYEFNENFNIEKKFLDNVSKMNYEKDDVSKVMKIDIMNTLNDNYLQKSDLSTMAYSLECRSPFLSKNLVEWALTVPSKFKVNYFNKKIILRELAKKYLPKEIIKKKKKGFEIPIKNWLRNELKNWSLELIKNDNNYKNLNLDKKKILDLFQLHLSGKRDCHPYLWAILVLLKFNEKK